MLKLTEREYLKYKQEYHELLAKEELLEKYPELKGNWQSDIHTYLEIKIKEDLLCLSNQNPVDPAEQENQKSKPVIWG